MRWRRSTDISLHRIKRNFLAKARNAGSFCNGRMSSRKASNSACSCADGLREDLAGSNVGGPVPKN
eukprot:11754768-Prorocentrum_lima.AAC.1